MKFYKLEATENHFIITLNENIDSQLAKQLCADNIGIIADGLINISNNNEITIFNKDGTIANMCGNGLRCVGLLLATLSKKDNFVVKINNQQYYLSVIDKEVIVYLDSPIFVRKLVPNMNGYFISCQNLHFVTIVDNIDNFTFTKELIELITQEHCNVHAIKIIDRKTIQMLSYESGVGQTKSCGSGALASFYLALNFNMVNSQVSINTLGGQLKVGIKQNKFYLQGNANLIYEGEYYAK